MRKILMAGVVASLSMSAGAAVTLPNALSDHAVLQRDVPIHVWGWADPKEAVTVKFHGQTAMAVADRFGAWETWLKPEAAGGPYSLEVSSKETSAPIVRNDMLVGEVWVASGQSNMEFMLQGRPATPGSQHPEIVAAATHPQMRILHIAHRPSAVPMADTKEMWEPVVPATAGPMSAVAYWFARRIMEEQKVPVGIIESSWGGTPAHAWISLGGIADNHLGSVVEDAVDVANGQGLADAVKARWAAEDAAAKAAGQPAPKRGAKPLDRGGAWTPGALFNGMIAPVVPYTIKGAIWYQGEADSSDLRSVNYMRVFPGMITDWRKQWGQGDFPFLYVQLSNWKNNSGWGAVRDAQRTTLGLRNTGMAVSLDVGLADNIHPPDKKTVGDRLYLAARNIAYGDKSVEFAGPLFQTAVVEGDAMRVYFTHADGLNAKGELGDFEIEDAAGAWSEAAAKIEGDTIVVSSATVKAPRGVRYAWHGEVDHYFYNKAGLPAGTFTSDWSK